MADSMPALDEQETRLMVALLAGRLGGDVLFTEDEIDRAHRLAEEVEILRYREGGYHNCVRVRLRSQAAQSTVRGEVL